jgi:hypothetical protein
MWILLVGCGLTCAAALLTQWVIWRVRTPARQSRAIVLIFVGWSFLGVFVFAHTWIEWAYFMTLQGLLTASYLVTFSAVEVDSPSLVMAEMLESARENGISPQRWHEVLNDSILVKPRIEDLIRDRHVERVGSQLVMTAKGRGFISLFLRARGVLKTPKGG